jgi:hypothetical protein
MEWISNLLVRLRALRKGENVHNEIVEEWKFHIERRTEENMRRGMSYAEARQHAERHFGNAGCIKDLRAGAMPEAIYKEVGPVGAGRGDVWRMVLRRGIVITGIAIAIGLLCAIGIARVIASLLFGASATDSVTFLLISALLCVVALAACFIPARRATRVDPVMAIRNL